ncbi:DUF721 domain-containing protein [Treponema sp. Marseille-Q4132]|uniref:DUF721 domain-containing protein n=1 Tax=Treponema sp. Marseille-Q4132 TaxID=2766701 RepID=UPI001652F3F3|nr:DUF721 domain-containing protein [Treponema sp. Marseille-Q4132]QNL96276.1 DUF721 domain-containing protein [Treponema sp. Marseille-Q4132]
MNNGEQNIVSAADMITSLFSNLDKKTLDQSGKLIDTWKRVVSKVRSSGRDYGEQLCAHTNPVQFEKGVLLVEADHPGWIQILQIYSKFILTGLQRAAPELGITTLSFKLKGSGAELCGKSYDEQVAEERRKIEKRYKKAYGEPEKNQVRKGQSLSSELQAKFDALKLSMEKAAEAEKGEGQ